MLTPEARAAVEAAKGTPEFAQVLSNVAKNYAEDIPGLLGKDIAAKEAMQAAQAAMPQTVRRLAAEKSRPQFGKDIRSLIKSYGEPVLAAAAGGYLGSELGGGPGAAAGSLGAGLLFGRTRAGKALMTRLTRPGNQAAMFKSIGRTAKGASRLTPKLGVAGGFALGEPLMSYAQERGKRSQVEAALDELLMEERSE
jgi:outer membrane lipoprotein SlyB